MKARIRPAFLVMVAAPSWLMCGCIVGPSKPGAGTFQRTHEIKEGISAGVHDLRHPDEDAVLPKPILRGTGAIMVIIAGLNMPAAVLGDLITLHSDKPQSKATANKSPETNALPEQ